QRLTRPGRSSMKHSDQGRKASKAAMMLGIVIAGVAVQVAVASPIVETREYVIPLSDWKNWKFLGGLNMYAPRQSGDVVKVRFFSPSNEELHTFSTTVSEDDIGGHSWALRLLEQIQKANIGV